MFSEAQKLKSNIVNDPKLKQDRKKKVSKVLRMILESIRTK